MQQKNASVKRPLIRIGVAVLLLALTFGFLFYYQNRGQVVQRLYDIRIIKPNCTDNEYSLYTLRSSGVTFTRDIVPSLGHNLDAWTVDREAGVKQLGVRSRRCSRCAYVEEETLYPKADLPVLSLEGDLEGIGKTTERNVHAHFMSTDCSFDSYATVKYQGHSAIGYEKKNYTLKLYEDEARTDKMKLTFSHWNKEHKYILKANYMDPTGCRNLAASSVWASVVGSRGNLPHEFETLSNFGAVDGFPIALYINREFQGLYTWNLHKDEDLFNMEDGQKQAVMVANTAAAPEAYFRAPAAFEENTPGRWNSAARKILNGQKLNSTA